MMHRHHRQKGTRQTDNRPVNILMVHPDVHNWIEEHPIEARDLGWSVSRYDNVDDVSVTIPKNILAEKPKVERKSEPTRMRAVYSTRIPQDALENGYEVLNTLNNACRDELKEEMGWSDTVSIYYVDVAVKADWLNGRKGTAGQ